MNRNTFAERQRQAVKNMGTVAEGLSEMQFPVLRLPKHQLYAYEAIEIELSDVTGSKEHIIEPYSPFGQHLATLSGAKLLKGVTKANQPGKMPSKAH